MEEFTDEFLEFKKLVEDFNEYGANGVVPDYRIDAEYIYDIKNTVKYIEDPLRGKIEVPLTLSEQKGELKTYALETFGINLSNRLSFARMLDELFVGVLKLNDIHGNDYTKEFEERKEGYSTSDLVYAISVMNNENVVIDSEPNRIILDTLEEVYEYKRASDKNEDQLVSLLDQETIDRIVDNDFIIGV